MQELLTQKWAIISLLENQPEGYEFHFSDTPLHITWAGVFGTDLSGKQLVKEAQTFLVDKKPVMIKGQSEELFGPEKDIPVTKIQMSDDVMQFHDQMHEWLKRLGVEYVLPQYSGAGFVPHVTKQKTNYFNPTQESLSKQFL